MKTQCFPSIFLVSYALLEVKILVSCTKHEIICSKPFTFCAQQNNGTFEVIAKKDDRVIL